MEKYRKSRNQLLFDVDSLENIILKTVDRFDIKMLVHRNEENHMRTVLTTSGLALLGSFLGRKVQGGHTGTVVGGVVGAACGLSLSIAVVSIRDVWGELKDDLGELFKLVYRHLFKLNITDYYDVETFLMHHISVDKGLAKIIIRYLSKKLHRQVVSSLM